MNPEPLNTGDGDLSHMAAEQPPKARREQIGGTRHVCSVVCEQLSVALQAVVDSLVTGDKAQGQPYVTSQ